MAEQAQNQVLCKAAAMPSASTTAMGGVVTRSRSVCRVFQKRLAAGISYTAVDSRDYAQRLASACAPLQVHAYAYSAFAHRVGDVEGVQAAFMLVDVAGEDQLIGLRLLDDGLQALTHFLRPAHD